MDNKNNEKINNFLDIFYKVIKIIFFPITLILWLLEIILDIFF